jgi:hypothetical protein
MATIVAICPYCREGGVRAPQSAVGASATCPKCRSSFTVMPSDGLPGWASEPQPAAPTPSAEETKPAAAMGMADVTEPSPVLTTEELPQSRMRSGPAPEPEVVDSPEPAEPADMGMVIALVALILFGAAVVASQFPFGRLIAAVLAAVGLVGGLLATAAEGRARKAGWLAVGLHAIVLLIVVLLPSWLKLDPWRGQSDEEGPKGPQALEHATRTTRPILPGEWLDAGRTSWELKDLRVTIRSANLGLVELTGPGGAKRTPKEQYLRLRVRVVNSGVEREIPLSGWAKGDGAASVTIVDSSGRTLKPASFEQRWEPDRGKPIERLFPGKTSELHFVFTAPAAKVEWLRVQLPGAALGVDEDIRFQIDSGFLARNLAP